MTLVIHQLDPLGKFFVSETAMRGAQSFGTAYSRQADALTSYDPASIRWYLSVGTETRPRVLKRDDGASIVYAPSYDSKRLNAEASGRNWLAFAPQDGTALRSQPMGKCGHNGLRASGYRRRWRTPYAAMEALDREFPCT